MTVYLSPLAGAGTQFFDNSGNILSGGLLYSYAAGTSTPTSTYTAAAGTVANSNPITLDSAGRVPYEIWLTEGQAYKFTLTDSAGSQIWVKDDIRGVNDLTVSGVSWSAITGEPTTIAGYGITDAFTKSEIINTYAPIASPTFTGTPVIPDNAATSANYAVGYRDAPQNSKTDSYTLVLADRGKSILMNGTSKTLTIPANSAVAFPVGTVIIIVNINSTALSIAITTDTLTLANSTTTGTRTLAQNGIATCVKIAATSWLISGAGLT